jgi:hypothetical protein
MPAISTKHRRHNRRQRRSSDGMRHYRKPNGRPATEPAPAGSRKGRRQPIRVSPTIPSLYALSCKWAKINPSQLLLSRMAIECPCSAAQRESNPCKALGQQLDYLVAPVLSLARQTSRECRGEQSMKLNFLTRAALIALTFSVVGAMQPYPTLAGVAMA